MPHSELAAAVEKRVEDFPLCTVLICLQVEISAVTKLLVAVAAKHPNTAVHLASYTGFAPASRQSLCSISGEYLSPQGNKTLTSASSSPFSWLCAI